MFTKCEKIIFRLVSLFNRLQRINTDYKPVCSICQILSCIGHCILQMSQDHHIYCRDLCYIHFRGRHYYNQKMYQSLLLLVLVLHLHIHRKIFCKIYRNIPCNVHYIHQTSMGYYRSPGYSKYTRLRGKRQSSQILDRSLVNVKIN